MNSNRWFNMDETDAERIAKRSKALALTGAGAYLLAGIVDYYVSGYSIISPLIMASSLGTVLAADNVRTDGINEATLMGLIYGIIGALLFHHYQASYPFFAMLVFGGMLGLALERGMKNRASKLTCAITAAAAGVFAFIVSGSIASSEILAHYLPQPVVRAGAGAAFGFALSLTELPIAATSRKPDTERHQKHPVDVSGTKNKAVNPDISAPSQESGLNHNV